MNLISKFISFMRDRYGLDEFSNFLFKLYILVLLINIFVGNYVVSALEIFLLVFIIFRFFSKNIYKRSRENQQFLKLKRFVLGYFKNIKDSDNVYKKCRKCHKTLKLSLPYKRGIKHVKCPNCGTKMKVLVLRQQKIEIIKGSGNSA